MNHGAGHPGEGGSITIESSEVGSSYGILPDLIVADEVTHWKEDDGLWSSLISSAAKRQNCLFLAITNSGFVDSWAWRARETVPTDSGWIFSRMEGVKAPWLSEKTLEEHRRMLPQVAFNRL